MTGLDSVAALRAFGAWPLPGLAAVCFVAGFTRGLTGFGAALVMAPAFSLMVGPRTSTALIVLIHSLTSLQGFRAWESRVAWQKVLWLGLVAAAANAIGTVLLEQTEPTLLRRVAGAAVVVLAVVFVIGVRWRQQGGVGATLLAGTASGVLTAIGGLGGPPAVYYFSGQYADSASVRANLLAFFTLLFGSACLLFAGRGELGMGEVGVALLLSPLFYIGGWLGEASFRRTSQRRLDHVVGTVLALSGLLALLM